MSLVGIQYKTCSFFGHRKIVITEELKETLKELIEDLIINHNVSTFLFGSRRRFDNLSHMVVTELKEKYPDIKRVAYTCRNETCILACEREKWEKLYSHFQKREVCLLCVEEEFEHKTKYSSGKASYIERNQAMIDDSDYCIFFFDDAYKPEISKRSKCSNTSYQPNSGTRLAYLYALKKSKVIFNLKDML